MIIAATAEGAFDVVSRRAVLDGRDVTMVARAGDEWWALVDGGRTVLHRAGSGPGWDEIELEGDRGRVLQPLGDHMALVGTQAAHVLRIQDDQSARLDAFDTVPGRSTWYNPASASRPDVWSCAGDGEGVYVSVHVGGLWRTDDLGATWVNVLEPEVDIHQVATADGLVVASAEGGFAVSRDRGATWGWTTEGLHASYLQSVVTSDGCVFVGASSGPFGKDAAVYRAAPAGERFERRSSGLPGELSALGPYRLAADGDILAIAPWDAAVHVSLDAGATWEPSPHELPRIHTLAVV